MFAHKPLCDKFKNDTIVLNNKIYLCKSCFCFYLGILSSFLFINLSLNINYLLLLSVLIAIFSYPKLYANNNRPIRNILRFSLGFFNTLLILNLIKIKLLYSIIYFTLCFLLKTIYGRARKKVDICLNCSELNIKKACSGYQKQTQALLQIEEELSDFIMNREVRYYD